MQILVTGGAGYIGSHTCFELLKAGYTVVVIDSLINSCEESLKRVQLLSDYSLTFVKGDVRDEQLLHRLFADYAFDAVIHFAGLKAVGESCVKPLYYYDNNLNGVIKLLEVMTAHNVKSLVFSSSATVYGYPEKLPLTEEMPLSATNPYGRSKLMVEDMLRDVSCADSGWNIALLRYFNPVGAHPSGMMGEDPDGTPNNLVPFITQVASGRLSELKIFGSDYETHDGTGVRDYIHVMDLARGHVQALKKLESNQVGCRAWNLGVGQGYSVLEVLKAFERVSGMTIPFKLTARRKGDVAVCYADVLRAQHELNWQAVSTLDQMLQDAWRWQQQNPQGYEI